MKPLYDRIIIRADEKEKTTSSGIVMSVSDDPTQPRKGTVVAVGDGYPLDDGTLRPMLLGEGDRVLYRPKNSVDITKPGSEQEYVLLPEQNVLAVLDEDE